MAASLAAYLGGNPLPFRFRELLTMAQLAAYLQKPSGEAARKWARRHRVPMTKCGREWRVDRRDVDAVMARDTQAAVAAQVGR
jgi:hypothetical protein